MSSPRTVSCPRCGAPVEWTPASRYRPFCSERCKMIDLGAWATEQYKVAGSEEKYEQESGKQRDRR